MEKLWYTLVVRRNHEKLSIRSIKLHLEDKKLEHLVEDFFLPEEAIFSTTGKKVTRRLKFPGTIYLKAKMTTELQKHILNLSSVITIYGKDRPEPVSEETIKLLFESNKELPSVEPLSHFKNGDRIKVLSGPFANMSAVVKAVNESEQKVKAEVQIFGRSSPVELSYQDIELQD
ncbi:MAG: transcription termination/antitermination protein NusG [Vicingaceae bacterium]